MANTLKIKRGTAATIPQGQLAEPLFTTDTYDLYIGKGAGGNQRIQNYIASGTSSQFLKGDGTLDSTSYQPLITAGTTSQYYRGDKTFQTLDTSVVPENGPIYFTEPRVRATVLTGLNLSGGGTIAATDSILTAFGKVQNQISALVGGATYQGVWNANTNTPTLASGTGTKGYYYVVSVAGSTNLDGITDWKIGDWAIFNGTTWDKVDNTDAVSSVNGFTGAVNLGLDNISDVSAASPTNAQILRFNGTSSLWENWTPNYVPYTGATADVDLGFNNFDANQINGFKIAAKLDGTNSGSLILRTGTTGYSYGNDAISLISSPTSANTLTIISDVSSVNKIAQFGLGSLTATRTYTLPDATGTLALTSNIPANIITGTGTSGRVAYWNSGTTIAADDSLLFSPTSTFRINNVITAAAGGASSFNLISTINAAANNDILYGVNINPTFNNGAFTGVTQRALGVFGNVYINGTITSGAWNGSVIGSSYGGAGTVNGILKANGSGTVSAAVAGTDYVIPSALSSYLPLSGGTLTGALSGTSATFSGRVNAATLYVNSTEYTFANFVTSVIGPRPAADGIANIWLRPSDASNNVGANISSNSTTFSIGSLVAGPFLSIALTGGAATFSSSVTAGGFIQSGGRTTTYGFRLPDWQIYNTSGGSLAFNNYTSDFLTISSTGAATFSAGVTIKSGNGDQLLLNNAGERFTQINFSNNTVSKANIWWDNTNTELVLLASGTGTGHLKIASTGAATFSSSVTATELYLSTSNGLIGNINSSNANGGYITWQTSGTVIADIGTAQQIFGAGGNSVFGINGRGARDIAFGTNNTERMRITSGGEVLINTTTDAGDFKLQVSGDIYLTKSSTYTQMQLKDGTASGSTWSLLSGFPNLGDFTIREAGVQNTLILSKTTGNATFIGSVTATSFFESSDIRLKSNIQDYKSNDILNISAKIYEKDGKIEVGYIAQDVEQILSSAVSKRDNEFLDLSYRQIHTAKIAALEAKIVELEAKLK